MRDDMQQIQQDSLLLIWLVRLRQKCVSMFALDFREIQVMIDWPRRLVGKKAVGSLDNVFKNSMILRDSL